MGVSCIATECAFGQHYRKPRFATGSARVPDRAGANISSTELPRKLRESQIPCRRRRGSAGGVCSAFLVAGACSALGAFDAFFSVVGLAVLVIVFADMVVLLEM